MRSSDREDWQVYADHLLTQDDPRGHAVNEALRSTAGNAPRWREAVALVSRGIYLRADMLLPRVTVAPAVALVGHTADAYAPGQAGGPQPAPNGAKIERADRCA